MSDSNTDGRVAQVSESVPETPSESQQAGITLNPMTSGLRSLRSGKNGPKHSHKVKFSMADGEGTHDEQRQTRSRDAVGNQIPEIKGPASEDVADHTLTPPDWEGRTHAAAAHALSRASRLANRLSTAGVSTKASSGSTTPIYAPTKGKFISSISLPLSDSTLDDSY